MRALVAGVTGAVGAAVARELSTRAGEVFGTCRNAPAAPLSGVTYLLTDLSDARSCADTLHDRAFTHVFYCARATHAEQTFEDVSGNTAMLNSLLDAISGPELEHVHLVQGGKVYGVHLGPFTTPARETDPRLDIPSFNYAQEDLLRERSAGARWAWSASRPNTLVHFAPGNGRNLASSLGAYAALCRAQGRAFDFPGPEQAYHSLTQVTSIELLARGMVWMATADGCQNEAFNLTNGDVFRWAHLWPKLAALFDMPCGNVVPQKLASTLAGSHSNWRELGEQHALEPLALEQVANWAYLDATLGRTWDELFSTNKARAFGFNEWADSEAAIVATVQRYRDSAILP